MMICGLVVGLISSPCAGFVCAVIARRGAYAKGGRIDYGSSVSARALHALAEVSNLVPLVLLDYARTHGADWRGPEKQAQCDQLTTIHKSSAYGINFLLRAPGFPIFVKPAFESVSFFRVDTLSKKACVCFQLGAPLINQSQERFICFRFLRLL